MWLCGLLKAGNNKTSVLHNSISILRHKHRASILFPATVEKNPSRRYICEFVNVTAFDKEANAIVESDNFVSR